MPGGHHADSQRGLWHLGHDRVVDLKEGEVLPAEDAGHPGGWFGDSENTDAGKTGQIHFSWERQSGSGDRERQLRMGMATDTYCRGSGREKV